VIERLHDSADNPVAWHFPNAGDGQWQVSNWPEELKRLVQMN